MPKDPNFYHSKSVFIKKKMVIKKFSQPDINDIPPLELPESFFSMMQRHKEMINGMKSLSLDDKMETENKPEAINLPAKQDQQILERSPTDQYSYFGAPVEYDGDSFEDYQAKKDQDAINTLLASPRK